MGQAALREPTKQEREQGLRDLYAVDFDAYAEDALKIRPKIGDPAPFVLNGVQKKVNEIARRQRARNGFIRAVVLKCRQSGISTLIQGRFYRATTFNMGLRAFVLTHEDKATQNLFGITKRYHKYNLPFLRPRTQRSNRIELDFNTLESSYRVATAKTVETGRSDTVQLFHGSEVAFWPNIAKIAAGALEAVPNEPGTEVWLESTANGRGNHFYRIWQAAKAGISGYIPIFVPWFAVPDYRSPCPNGVVFDKDEGDEGERFKLTADQLYWRRLKLNAFEAVTKNREAAESLFKQEYPATDVEAFSFSGSSIFSPSALARMERDILPPKAVGTLVQYEKTIKFQENSQGYLEIYEWPDEEKHYVVGGDVAEGLELGDRHSGQVLTRPTPEDLRLRQAARFAPVIPPDEFGNLCVLVAKYYGGNVPIGVERTGTGIAAVMALIRTEYPHLLTTTVGGPDKEKGERRTGWLTNVATKPQLESELAQLIRDGGIVVRSEETHNQLTKYQRDENTGKTGAEEGEHDDEVMALGVAVQTFKKMPKIVKEFISFKKRQEGGEDSFNIAPSAWNG